MLLRQRLSANLRRLCDAEPSYAHVARALGINRQQFNDYLSGKSLPNEGIIRNVCNYFNVDISELFKNDEIPIRLKEKYTNNIKNAILKNQPDIKEGNYYCYFSLNNEGNGRQTGLFRSLLLVRKNSDGFLFRRFTRAPDVYVGVERSGIGRHFGVVVEIKDEIAFIGVNIMAPHEPTLIVVQKAFSPEVAFFGRGITMANRYTCPKVVIVRVPDDKPLRTLIRSTGYMTQFQSPEIEPVFAKMAQISSY